MDAAGDAIHVFATSAKDSIMSHLPPMVMQNLCGYVISQPPVVNNVTVASLPTK
jgi:hypothetical protein